MQLYNPSDTVRDGFTTRGSTGALVDADSTPTAAVYKNGTADGTVTVTVTNVTTGVYKYSFSIPSGYASGDVVQTLVTSVIGGVTVKGWDNPFVVATSAAARIGVNVVSYANGQAPLQPTVAGRTLDVALTGEAGVDLDNIKQATGSTTLTNITVPAVTAVGSVTGAVGSVTGAVGSVTGSVGGNVSGSVGSVASGGITAASLATGAITRATLAADTGYQTARSNTAQAGAATSVTLDASASSVTDFYAGTWVYLTGGTGIGQARLVTAYNGTSKVATVSTAWATNPDATTTFAILPAAAVAGIVGTVTGSIVGNITGNLSGSVGSVTGAVGSVTGAVGSVTGSVGSVTGSVGSVTGAVGSVTGNVGGDVTGKVLGGGAGTITGDGVRAASVTGNVGGNVTGSVGSLAAQAKTDVQAADAAAMTAWVVPTVAQLNARTLVAADYATAADLGVVSDQIAALHDFDPGTDTVAHVTLVDLCTANTDMRGTDGAYTGTPPTVQEIADGVALIEWGDYEDAAGPLSLVSLIGAAFLWSTTAHSNKLTVFKTDGTTEFHQYPLSPSPGAAPITAMEA